MKKQAVIEKEIKVMKESMEQEMGQGKAVDGRLGNVEATL